MKPFSRHVVIFARFGRDAPTAESLLRKRRIETSTVATFEELVAAIDPYVGAVLLTDESLSGADLSALAEKLDAQPSWSDIPFVVLTQRSRLEAIHQRHLVGLLPARMTNLVYVERPASALTLTSAVEAALSGRERQFRIRDELRAAAQMNERLSVAEATLARSHQDLERLVAERTAELRKANARLWDEMEERKRAEEALAHAQKMEAVGRLTGGIAHDFNNLLMALVANLELARRRLGEEHPVLPFLNNAFRATERGSKLSGQLLAFSRIQKLVLEPVDVDALMHDLIDLARHSLGIGHSIETKFQGDDLCVVADPNQIELAILNLVNNARDAMEEGGVITLSTQKRMLDETDAELPAGQYVEIAVSDTGTGIDRESLKRIFDPFYTTKPVGKGTGLGLAQVWGIAHQCGGAVRVSSQIGKGTCFSIWLPVSESTRAIVEEARPAPNGHIDDDRAAAATSVLVIDDDDNVRESLVAGLLLDEFSVREARSGADGLAMITDDFPSVLVVDFAMPFMNGADVARAAQKIRPGLPIVMVTGYSDTAALDGVANAQILRKPFELAELGRQISSLHQSALRS
ncbi:ATP-binding protein [Caballeronia cordobensis]|uniref:ATP-binding protein n=1 Tax=Caballeronia cordobensis TaxID=1353886 RepID=UPI00045EDFAA|nr:histidine kinase [Burkholderia sp. RPE67]